MLPMLLVLLLGIADFGRVFAASIVLEASARNAAEAAAQEYLQLSRSDPSIDTDDYQRVHDVALAEVCREAERLPEEVDADDDGVCEMPLTAVCVHDVPAHPDDVTPPPVGGDSICGIESASTPQPDCNSMVDDPADPSDARDAWTSTKDAEDIAPTLVLAYVEVRVCYRFRTLFPMSDLSLPFGWGISIGDTWIQRDRSFTVADY